MFELFWDVVEAVFLSLQTRSSSNMLPKKRGDPGLLRCCCEAAAGPPVRPEKQIAETQKGKDDELQPSILSGDISFGEGFSCFNGLMHVM